MTNYDANKDNTLDENEVQRLWNDIQSYDYAGIVAADVSQAKAWIAKFDTNKDGKITFGELVKAIESETGPLSLAKSKPYKPAVTKPKPVVTKPIKVKPYKPSKSFKPFKHAKDMKYTEDDLKEYAQWILDNYDFDMNGYLDSTEMIQVNIDFPNVFFSDSNYDYQYSYYEIVSALRNSYNPYTSMIEASNSTNAEAPYVPVYGNPYTKPTVIVQSEEDRKL
jgi:Ca2+-binding EF-hand superfamily protein